MKVLVVSGSSDSGPGVELVGTSIRSLDNGVESEYNGSERREDVSEAEIRGASSLLKMRESGRDENLGKLGNDLAAKETAVSNGLSSCDGNFVPEAVNNGVEEMDEVLANNKNDPDDKVVTINVPIADMSENIDVEEDDLDEVGFEFSVGDFVWGKIKSHPWWPGLIYDPSNASDYAVKLKHKNRLLVAYFGDGTFAWCHPSQLKPFEENFEEMLKQSNSKSFLNAVQNAVDEIARLVQVKTSCSCKPEQSMMSLSWPFAENAGIKEGVLVPGGGIEKFLNSLPEPAGFLTELKSVAKTISFTSLLHLRIIESQLTAFYHSKGFYPLPIYHESRPIPGLEDNSEVHSVDTGKFCSTVNNPMQGPSEEDWLPSPIGIKFDETDKYMLHKCQGMPGSRLHQRRKQKSIAEIMDTRTENKEGITDTDVSVPKLVQSAGRGRKRKLDDASESQYVDLTSIDGKIKKTKHVGDLPSPTIEDSRVRNDGGESKEKSGKRGRKRKGAVNSGNDGIGEDQDVKDTEMLNDSSRISGGLTNEQIGKSYLSRERKNSKYLSPPFTNISRGKMKRDKVDSKNLPLAEGMMKAASHCADSSSIIKSTTPDTFRATLSDELDLKHCKLRGLGSQTPRKDESKNIDPMNVGASTEEVLIGVRCAAVDPQYLFQTKPFETVGSFIAALRSCIYHHGSNYKMYNKRRPGRRRKNQDPEQVLLQSMDKTRTADSVIEKHKMKRKRGRKNSMPDELKSSGTPETRAADRSKVKRIEKASDKKPGAKESEEKDSPAAVFVTFGPGSSLPSRADLIKIYSKFGTLNEMETDVFSNNFCARATFFRSSDAEEAFSRSQIVRPFGDTNVKFMLRYSSPASETHGSIELSQPKISQSSKSIGKNPQKAPTMQSSVGEASQLQFIRKKLESISSMLENSNGKVSPDLKSKLQGEMKGLLEEVSTMVGSSSSS